MEMTALVGGGQLQVSWRYELAEEAAVQQLMQCYEEELVAVLDHCRSGEGGGYTPSDFLSAKLNDQQLNKILNTVVFEGQS